MSLLVFALVVAIIVGLLVWAIRTIPIPSPLNVILQIAVVLVAVLVIAQRAGLF